MDDIGLLHEIQMERLSNARALNDELKIKVLASLRELEKSEALMAWEKGVAYNLLGKIGSGDL